MAKEEVPGPAHAHIGFERQPAQTREQARPAPAAQLVPDQIDGQRHRDDRARHEQEVHASLRREGADREEGRDRRQWDPDLLGDDQDRQDDRTVPLEQLHAVSQVHDVGRFL